MHLRNKMAAQCPLFIHASRLTPNRAAMPFGNRKISEDLLSSAMSQFEKYYPSENLKFNNLGIFQSLKFRIWMEKIVLISLKLNSTPITLGCCQVTCFTFNLWLNLKHIRRSARLKFSSNETLLLHIRPARACCVTKFVLLFKQSFVLKPRLSLIVFCVIGNYIESNPVKVRGVAVFALWSTFSGRAAVLRLSPFRRPNFD